MKFRAINSSLITTRDNYNIKISIIKQVFLVIMLIILILMFLPQFNFSEEKYLLYLSWIGNMTFIISIYLYYKATYTIICPYIMFYFSFFCFQFGQLFLYSLGVNYEYIHLGFYASLWDNNINILLNGVEIIIFSIALFNLGALISLLSSNNKKNFFNSFNDNVLNNKAIRISGWVLFTITIFPSFYDKFKYMMISVQYGYLGTYTYARDIESIFSSLYILFIPSCILLLVNYKKNRVVRLFIQSIMFIYGGITLVGGARTEGIAVIIVLILYNNILVKRINIRRMSALAISIILTLALIGTIGDYRGLENKTADRFIPIFIENIYDKNPIVKSIGEMGWSMGTVFMTMKIVPDYMEYKYGKSYLASLSRVFPASLDITGNIGRLHEESMLPGNFITQFYSSNFGMGTSLIAESYYNFGYFGVIAIFFIGIIIGKILAYKGQEYIDKNKLVQYIKLITLYSLFTLPRRELGYLITQCFYVIFVVIFLIVIIRKICNKYRLSL